MYTYLNDDSFFLLCNLVLLVEFFGDSFVLPLATLPGGDCIVMVTPSLQFLSSCLMTDGFMFRAGLPIT